MNQCKRCHGDGYIFGHWMPELCPECRDEDPDVVTESAPASAPATSPDWWLVVAKVWASLIIIGFVWGLIEFLASLAGVAK